MVILKYEQCRYDDGSRLNRLTEFQNSLAKVIPSYALDGAILSLEDYRGQLIVTWANYHSFQFFASTVNEIWTEQFGEPFVEHQIANMVGSATFTSEPVTKSSGNMEITCYP